MALVLVTHNMGVVAEMARRVAVMYAGQVMEEREAEALFAAPQHPYTAALLAAMPERSAGGDRLATIPGVVPGLLRPSAAAACSRRAAPMRRDAAVASRRRCGRGGTGSCAATIPLGDPDRDAAIAREGRAQRSPT